MRERMGVELGRWGGRVIWEELVGEEKLVIKIYYTGKSIFNKKKNKNTEYGELFTTRLCAQLTNTN